MTQKERAAEILKRLKEAYPNSCCSLDFRTPEQLLVATMLSAQCTDKQVNRVTPALFVRYPDAKAFAAADLEELKTLIKPTGFYNNKAKSIKQAMTSLREKFHGAVPDNMDDLLSLAGVGRKTANVVLGDAFNTPGIVVDTHVKRLANRMGFTKSSDPDKIEKDLEKLFPKPDWTLLGHLMIDLGREICQARKPLCETCFLKDLCPQKIKG